MYGYIYDVFLNQKPFEKEVIRIENSLTDLGLSGQIVRLSLINNIAHAVADLLKRGATTIVAVGSDQLFSKLADQVAEKNGITLGLIPLGTHQQLATLFGIPEGEEATKVLAARLVRPVHLSKINNAYFIHSVVVYDPRVKVSFNGQFSASATTQDSLISISNLQTANSLTGEDEKTLSVQIAPATDKKFLRKQESLQPTAICCLQAQLSEPAGIPIIVDGQKVINTPAQLEITNEKIQVIMGRDRQL